LHCEGHHCQFQGCLLSTPWTCPDTFSWVIKVVPALKCWSHCTHHVRESASSVSTHME